MSHYYTDNKDLASKRSEFTYYFDNEVFRFTTDNGVFSKSSVDYGTYVLLKNIYKLDLGKHILDLGSGYGPIGIILKRFDPNRNIEMVDVNSRAIELAKINCETNKVDIKLHLCDNILNLDHKFNSIVLNPPIRAGKKIIYDLYDKSAMMLSDTGHLYIVIQKKQGAQSTISKLETLFNEVNIIDRDGGYHIIDSYNIKR